MVRFDFQADPEISKKMRRIRGKDTGPELVVRRLCRELGQPGYRIHRKELPGKPDIVYIGRKAAIFVHGCFWHGHKCQAGSRKPRKNQTYWLPKIERNIQRDIENIEKLYSNGWRVLVIWECELKQIAEVKAKIAEFLATYLVIPKIPSSN